MQGLNRPRQTRPFLKPRQRSRLAMQYLLRSRMKQMKKIQAEEWKLPFIRNFFLAFKRCNVYIVAYSRQIDWLVERQTNRSDDYVKTMDRYKGKQIDRKDRCVSLIDGIIRQTNRLIDSYANRYFIFRYYIFITYITLYTQTHTSGRLKIPLNIFISIC